MQKRKNFSVLGTILAFMLLHHDWSTERGESVFLFWSLSTLIQQVFDTTSNTYCSSAAPLQGL